jgi:hypothetical protein
MSAGRFAAFLIVSLLLIVSGCAQQSSSPPPPDKEAKIKASLDKLDPDDRKMAQEQTYCAVETENRLGSMGKPVKIMVKDQPVFLCCKGCEKTALKDPEKTLATVKRLKDGHESHE